MDKCQSHETFSGEERIVFEEINRWHRYVISTGWLVTSFFIGLNFLIVRVVSMASKGSIFNAFRHSVIWGLVFTGLCLVQYGVSLSMVISSVKLMELMRKKDMSKKDNNSNNFLRIEKLTRALEFKWSDFLSIKRIGKAIATSWGILSTAYTLLFIVAWWILVYN